jgi:hypothetical protein
MFQRIFLFSLALALLILPSVSYSAYSLSSITSYNNDPCRQVGKAVCACVVWIAVTSGNHSDDLAIATDNNNGACYSTTYDCKSACVALNNPSSFLWVAAINKLSSRDQCTAPVKADHWWGRSWGPAGTKTAFASGAIQNGIVINRKWSR